MEIKYPEINVQLTGKDGNAWAVMGAVTRALTQAGISKEERNEFFKEAISGDYDHVLMTAMRWVNVE